jgi:ribose transport system substrate-binding protein
MTRNKWIAVSLMAGVWAVGTAHAFAQDTPTIGYITLNQKQEIFISQTAAAQEWAAAHGYDLLVGDPDNDALAQLNIIQGWLDADQVDALFIGPLDVASLSSVIALAGEKGIPTLIASGLEKPSAPKQAVLVVDWIKYGTNAGEALADCVNEKLGGTAKVAILEGPNLPGTIVSGRIDGEKAALAANAPNAEVVAQQNGEGQRLVSLDVMSALLLQEPGINAVTGTNDDSMIGVVKAYEAAGIDPSTVCIVGLDATAEGIDLVKKGAFYATIDLQPIRQIIDGLDAIDAIAKGTEAPNAPGGIITVDTKALKKADIGG